MESTHLFERAAKLIQKDISLSKDGDSTWVTLILPSGRKQGVRLSIVDHEFDFSTEKRTIIHIDSLVGPMNSSIDPEYLLECTRSLCMARVCLLDDRKQNIAIEGRLPLNLTTPDLLAALIAEVAYCADSLEKDLFEVDIN